MTTTKEIIKMLTKEIQWCKKNNTDKEQKLYRKAFINGLENARFLIKQIDKIKS